MIRYIIALSLAVSFAPPAFADEPVSTPADKRMRVLEYDANDIYTIMTRVGYQTNIEFGTHEEIETISVGDRAFWQIIPSGNRLFIRPVQDDVSTNMTVITSRRSYQFDLSSTADKDQNITYVARFTYPTDHKLIASQMADPFNYSARSEAAAALAAANAAAPIPPAPQSQPLPPAPFKPAPSVRPDAPEFDSPRPRPDVSEPVTLTRSAPIDTAPRPVITPKPTPSREAGNRNYLYTFSGQEDAAPYEVYDDGVATYFRYRPPVRTAPDVFVQEAGGEERPLTVYEKDGFFAVDTVAPVIAVKRGDVTVFIHNEMLSRP